MRLLSWLTKKIFENKLLVLILIFAFIPRFLGTNPGVYFEGDEVSYGQAIRMITNGNLLIDSSLLGYPPLLYWIMLTAFLVFFIPAAWIYFAITNFQDFFLTLAGIYKGSFGGMVGFEQIFRTEILGDRWVSAMYWGRYLTVVVGVGVVFLTYKVCLEFFENKKAALIAALMAAFNYRLTLNSMVGFHDMYNAFFLLLSILLTSKIIKNPSTRNYLLAWIGVTLSFLIKYQTYSLLPLLIAHTYVSKIRSNGTFKGILKNFFNRGVVLGGIISLTLVIASHGQYFVEWERTLDINNYETIKYSFYRNAITFFPISYLYHVGIGPLISILFLIGAFLGIADRKTRLNSIMLLSPILPFSYVYFYFAGGGYHTRNLISVIPICIIFASFFLSWFYERANSFGGTLFKLLSSALIILLLFFLLKDHAINILAAVKAYSSQSNYFSLKSWLEENIKGKLVYGQYPINPTPTDKEVEVRLMGPVYKSFSYIEKKEEGFDYLTLDMTDVVEPQFLWWTNQPTKMSLMFWKKPNNLLSQNYAALAIREYLWSHTVKTFLSPWQAPNFSYVVVKINKEESYESVPFKEIAKYDFKENSWIRLSYLKEQESLLTECASEEKTSCIGVTGSSIPGSVRWESPVTSVKEGHAYKVSGMVKNSLNLDKGARDGFLRVDFYKEEPSHKITSRSFVSFVSKRVYGESEWQSSKVEVVAPEGVNYMTIGFQADSPNKFELTDVVIEESLDTLEFQGFDPVIITDDNLFFPSLMGYL